MCRSGGNLQEVGFGYVDWIGLAQDRDRWWTLVSAVMNFQVPWNAGNFLSSCKLVSCTRRTLHRGVSNICISMHIKFPASRGRAFIMYYRQLGEFSNITRRNLDTTIINCGRTKLWSWKNNKKRASKSCLVTCKVCNSEARDNAGRIKDRVGLKMKCLWRKTSTALSEWTVPKMNVQSLIYLMHNKLYRKACILYINVCITYILYSSLISTSAGIVI